MATIPGGAFSDFILGASASDYILAGGGDDSVFAGSGDDIAYGEGGNDTLIGGSGQDYIDGGAGIDTAVYAGSSAGVTVDLANGTASGGDADGPVQIVGRETDLVEAGKPSVHLFSPSPALWSAPAPQATAKRHVAHDAAHP